MIINLLATWIPALGIAFLGVLKLTGNPRVAEEMSKLGVGRYLRLLGVMEIAFAALFVVPDTMKLGFILASCYFAGAIATELSHEALKLSRSYCSGSALSFGIVRFFSDINSRRCPMSHLSSQPTEIRPENPSQSTRSAGNAWAREKRFADVLGRRMAYIERGVGHPIVFLHGNPTSSFLWRGVLPHFEASGRRLIAPDLIGMGDSDKIPAGAEPDRYRFASHARYLDAFIDEVVGTEPLTLVLHDWGGALGFDWAYRHQQRVRAMAYMETFVTPLTLEDLPESFRPTLKAVRSSAGEALVLDENMFIEKMLPGVTQRTLSADEMAEYRRPFLEAGDDRWPTLQWAREVPLSGEPADVRDRIAAYSAWLKTASLPKLFIDAEPGVFITGRIRRLASSFPNQHHVIVRGLHFVQEDSPDEIGRAIAGWLERI